MVHAPKLFARIVIVELFRVAEGLRKWFRRKRKECKKILFKINKDLLGKQHDETKRLHGSDSLVKNYTNSVPSTGNLDREKILVLDNFRYIPSKECSPQNVDKEI